MIELTKRWQDRFGSAYNTVPPAEICWNACTASAELYQLVCDRTIGRGSTVVDLGCGFGMETIFLASQGMRAYGVDLSPIALAKARELQAIFGVDVTWLQADAGAVPLPDGSADVVNDRFLFHNVDPPARQTYACAVFRLLKPHGQLILRGFSDNMSPGSGPYRLSSDDLLSTFLPGFACERLSRFQNLPTESRPEQSHWFSLWRRRAVYGEDPAAIGLP